MKPKLRFKEFTDDWEEKKLGEISERIQGNLLSDLSNIEILTISASKGWLKQKDRFSKVIAGNELKNYTLLKNGELSYNHGNSKIAPYGTVFVQSNYDKALVPKVYHSFKVIGNSNKFIQYYFETRKLDRGLRKLVSSSARMDGLLNITYNNFMTLLLYLPSLPEQEKIGTFLSLVDQRIEKTEKKVSLLKEEKKGWMQKLFQQEIRFKDEQGNDYPDWEEKKLGDIGKFIGGTSFPESEQGGNEGTPFYKVSDLNLLENKKEMRMANNYVSKHQIEKNKWKPIKERSILFAKVGAAIFLERKRIFNNGIFDNNLMAFIPNKDNDLDFVYHYFTKIKLSRFAQVGALPSYNASDLKTIKFFLPSLPEQEKIASFLSLLDQRIEKEECKVELLKEEKKGLLQNMFV